MQSMRDVLRGSLGRSLQTMQPLDRLRVSWPVACGTALARKGVVMGLEGGVLSIQVKDAAWLEHMLGMSTVLQNELTRISEVKLAGIHFYGVGSHR